MASKRPVKVTVKDNGYKAKLKAILEAGKGFNATVGIHTEDMSGGIGLKAAVLEFGSDVAEPRGFVSGFADANGAQFVKDMGDQMKAALAANKNPVQRADQLVQKFAGEMQDNFPNLLPNKQSTIDKKGSSTPGVDTGDLRSRVRGKIEGK